MTAADFPLVLSLSLWRCRFVKCICSLRDQSLNPNISPSTDPSPSCIWPLPDPHSYLIFPSLSWCWPQPSSPSLPRKIPVPPLHCSPTPSHQSRLGSPPGRGQTDQNQSQVDQLSPTATWWNVFSKPCSILSGLQQMDAHVTDTAAVGEWHYLSPQQPLALSWGKISSHVHWLTLHSRNTLWINRVSKESKWVFAPCVSAPRRTLLLL